MALWKRSSRYWTYFSVNGVQLRRPLCPPGSTLATTNWQEATRLEKEMIRAALAGELAPRDPNHYLWCANQHHKFDPTKPARKWDTAWRALRDAAGLPGFRFHDLRHTVVTDLLEAGEPEHVIEAVTGHLSRRMLEHYSHQRLKAKGQMLARLEERRKKGA